MDAANKNEDSPEPFRLSPTGETYGMTRAEMLERVDHHESAEMAGIEFQTEVMFAWLVAMFFIAHRLSRPQFLIGCFMFSLITVWNCVNVADNMTGMENWYALAGYGNSTASLSIWDKIIWILIGDYWLKSFMALSAYVACIWFAISCRRNQAKELGSPL